MAFDTLLNHVPVARENIHIMQTENISPEESANAYETILKQYFPTFDSSNSKLPLSTWCCWASGMMATLSLFPGKTEVIQETENCALLLWLEEQNIHRITLTHPIVNQSAAVAFCLGKQQSAGIKRSIVWRV